MAVQRRQTYVLGGLFVGVQVVLLSVAVFRLAETALAGLVLFTDLIQALLSTVAGVAAVGRSAWRWNTLITAIALDIGFRVYIGINLTINGRMRLPIAATLLVWMIVDGLWFIYFYRRRAMFGGSRRWRWLERYAPVINGPDRYEVQPSSSTIITPPPPGTFGLSRRGTILLAIAAVTTLLIAY